MKSVFSFHCRTSPKGGFSIISFANGVRKRSSLMSFEDGAFASIVDLCSNANAVTAAIASLLDIQEYVENFKKIWNILEYTVVLDCIAHFKRTFHSCFVRAAW